MLPLVDVSSSRWPIDFYGISSNEEGILSVSAAVGDTNDGSG